METYRDAIKLAIDAARDAGKILREEFHRPGGPRGAGGKAPSEREAEYLIGQRLTTSFPDWGFIGEEEAFPRRSVKETPAHVWLVDPNDGTEAFLKGFRGSAISIGLLRDGEPILGVVYAFCAPDDDGDLFAWAEGCGPLTRNGIAVQRPPWPAQLGKDQIVHVGQSADRNPEANAICVSPGRYLATPSIAYRLALAAVGEGNAGVSLNGPGDWDYAGGHALLRAVGCAFVDERGKPVTYTRDGHSSVHNCFGGAPCVVSALVGRPWSRVFERPEPDKKFPPGPMRLVPGQAVSDAGRLRRAQGCLLGQLAGDSLGSLVEFQSPEHIKVKYPEGPREFSDGGTWNTIAGQPTDDSELALMLARSIVATGTYDPEAATRAYAGWLISRPFDIGGTTAQALGALTQDHVNAGRSAAVAAAAAKVSSKANGALMRISPLGIWGCGLPTDKVADYARADARVTHPNPVCQDANAVFVAAISRAISSGGNPQDVYDYVVSWADHTGIHTDVREALRLAVAAPHQDFMHQSGYVLLALQNAFYQLLHASNLEAGVVDTVRRGGDTDTNGAIAGALLGAVHGREEIPRQWRLTIRSCRPMSKSGAKHPRPIRFWPVDALELAERLLISASVVGSKGRL